MYAFRWIFVLSLCLVACLQGCTPESRARAHRDRVCAFEMDRAETLLARGKKSEALRAIDKAIRLKPSDHGAYRMASAMMYDRGMCKEMIPLLRRGIAEVHAPGETLNPEGDSILRSDLCILLALAHQKLGQTKECEKAYADAIRLDPNNVWAHNDLGYMYADAGKNLPEALRLTTRAMKLRPNDGMIVDSVGWTYFRMGRKHEALEYLKSAVVFCPSDSAVRTHLGEAYEACGHPHAALVEYTKALRLNSTDTTARKHREQLAKLLSKK